MIEKTASTRPALICRLATLDDVNLLAGLNQQLSQDEGQLSGLTFEQVAERLRTWLGNDYRAVIFEQSNEVVAYALYCIGERFEGDRFIFLRHFFVQRAHRRRGIGREAMRLLLKDVFPPNARILLDVLFQNQGARDFWKRIGFKEHCLTLEWAPNSDSQAS